MIFIEIVGNSPPGCVGRGGADHERKNTSGNAFKALTHNLEREFGPGKIFSFGFAVTH
jgi:hypothetical protein